MVPEMPDKVLMVSSFPSHDVGERDITISELHLDNFPAKREVLSKMGLFHGFRCTKARCKYTTYASKPTNNNTDITNQATCHPDML